MELELAESLWKQDPGSKRWSVDEKGLLTVVQGRSRALARQVRRRDWLELAVGLGCGAFFFYHGALGGVLRFEWLALAAGCWFVSAVFVRERRRARSVAPSEGASMSDALKSSLHALDHQIRLSRGIFWWYCLPLLVPLVLVALRFERFAGSRYGYISAVLGVMAVIVAVNRWIAASELAPQRRVIAHLLDEVEGNGSGSSPE